MKVFVLCEYTSFADPGQIEVRGVFPSYASTVAAAESMNQSPFEPDDYKIQEFDVQYPVDPIALIRRLLAATDAYENGKSGMCRKCGGNLYYEEEDSTFSYLFGHEAGCPYGEATAFLKGLETKP